MLTLFHPCTQDNSAMMAMFWNVYSILRGYAQIVVDTPFGAGQQGLEALQSMTMHMDSIR